MPAYMHADIYMLNVVQEYMHECMGARLDASTNIYKQYHTQIYKDTEWMYIQGTHRPVGYAELGWVLQSVSG